MTDVKRYRLYGTSACHLCEQAETLLEALNEQGVSVTYEKVDIANRDDLFERYGLLIPVLQNPQGSELLWPFDAAVLRDFVTTD